MISLAPFSVPIKNLQFMASATLGRDNVPDGLQRRKRAVFFPDSSVYQTGLSVTVTGTITDFEVDVTSLHEEVQADTQSTHDARMQVSTERQA